MPRGMKYPQELRDRAVRMVAEIGEPGAVHRVAVKLGVHDDTLRYWIKRRTRVSDIAGQSVAVSVADGDERPQIEGYYDRITTEAPLERTIPILL